MELGSLLPSKRKALFQRLPFVPSPDVGGGGGLESLSPHPKLQAEGILTGGSGV